MKKLLLFTFFISSFYSFSQLNPYAEAFKNSKDEWQQNIYQNAKQQAVDMWGDNHVMIVSTINQNIDAILKFIELMDKYNSSTTFKNVLADALKTWVEDSDTSKFNQKKSKGTSYVDIMGCCKYNWVMVVSQIEQQMEAANAY